MVLQRGAADAEIKVPSDENGVGQYIAMHATLTARDFFLAIFFTYPVHSPAFFPKPLSSFSYVSCG